MLSWFLKRRGAVDSSETVEQRLRRFNDEQLSELFTSCQAVQARLGREVDLSRNLVLGLVELYITVNSTFNFVSEKQTIERMDIFLSAASNSDISIELLFKTFLLKCKSKRVDSTVRKHMIEFILHSDSLQRALLDRILNNANLFASPASTNPKNHELAFDLLEMLIKYDSATQAAVVVKDKTVEKLFSSFMTSSIRFLDRLNEASLETTDLNELNNYLRFNTSLLFRLDTSYLLRFVDLSQLWSILLNNLVLKESLRVRLSKANRDKVDANLNELMNSIASIMISQYLLNRADDVNAFGELKTFITARLNDKRELVLSELILGLIGHFEFALRKLPKSDAATHWLNDFYTNILFNLNFQFDFDQAVKFSQFLRFFNAVYFVFFHANSREKITFFYRYGRQTSLKIASHGLVHNKSFVFYKRR
jgi:hypothetical protein